jgi:hypothetical protein
MECGYASPSWALFSVEPTPEGTDTKTEEEQRKFRPQHGSGSNRTNSHFIFKAIDDGM